MDDDYTVLDHPTQSTYDDKFQQHQLFEALTNAQTRARVAEERVNELEAQLEDFDQSFRQPEMPPCCNTFVLECVMHDKCTQTDHATTSEKPTNTEDVNLSCLTRRFRRFNVICKRRYKEWFRRGSETNYT